MVGNYTEVVESRDPVVVTSAVFLVIISARPSDKHLGVTHSCSGVTLVREAVLLLVFLVLVDHVCVLALGSCADAVLIAVVLPD